MTTPDSSGDAAARMRRAFDEGFARAAAVAAPPSEDFLAVRLRGDPHLLRQAEIARLLRFRAVTRYPAPAAAWLGLAGVAGAMVPVYDLGVLMGYPPDGAPGWMVVCSAAPVALAFEAFDGHFRVAREGAEAATRADVLRLADASRPVVSVAAVLETVRSLARPDA